MSPKQEQEEQERKTYTITPTYKKSSVEEQFWTNTLKSGKSVTVKVYNVYRWSNFNIELTDAERDEILEMDQVNLCDYDFEMIDMTDGGCDFGTDICNESSFTSEEIDEINDLLEEDEETEDMFFDERMESKGWVEGDCEYILTCKCDLELVE